MSETQRDYSPEEVRALEEVVRHTDISLYGPLYDHYLATLRSETPGLTTGEYERRAFDATTRDPIIQRVGIDAVAEAFKGEKYGTQHFSDGSKGSLNRFISEREVQQAPSNLSPAQK